MAKLTGANDYEKLKDLCTKTYKEQSVWFLNAFWEDFASKEAEKLWNYAHKIAQLDLQKGAEGNEVDEVVAHRFLEHFQETQTVREMRDNLRETGAVQGNIKMFPLEHHLIFRYKADWHKLVNAPQGDNSKEIAKAQKMLDEVQVAFREAESKAQAAKVALKEAEATEAEAKRSAQAARSAEDEAKASEANAKKREAEAKAAAAEAKAKEEDAVAKEAEAKTAQEELERALQDLKEQEETYRKKTEELQARSEDESTGVVQRNKAKNELSQHLAKDPLPLSRAKITQEAAVKKADKATQAAASARQSASASRASSEQAAAQASKAAKEAEAARRSAEQAAVKAAQAKEAATQAAQAAEDAADEMSKKVDEAEAYLQEVKAQPGCAFGSIWWIERELEEQKKYMPERKGGKKK